MDWKLEVEKINKLEEENKRLKTELEAANKALAVETTNKQYLKEEIAQLKQQLHEIESKYQLIQYRAVPEWLTNEAMIKHNIILMPFKGCLYILKKADIVINSIKFCYSEKIHKLPKVYHLPNKLYIGLCIANNSVVHSGVFFKNHKLSRYTFAHSGDYICATYSTTISSLEDYLRAIKFILMSFETLNLQSTFDPHRFNKSFKRIFLDILNEAIKFAPREAKGVNGMLCVNSHEFDPETI